MDDTVEHGTIALALVRVAEDAAAERCAVQGATLTVGSALGHAGGGLDEEVLGGGGEVAEDGGVARCSGLDDLAGDEVGVDDGEGVG